MLVIFPWQQTARSSWWEKGRSACPPGAVSTKQHASPPSPRRTDQLLSWCASNHPLSRHPPPASAPTSRHWASGDLTEALIRLLTSLLMARRSVARMACSRATAWNCMHEQAGCRKHGREMSRSEKAAGHSKQACRHMGFMAFSALLEPPGAHHTKIVLDASC